MPDQTLQYTATLTCPHCGHQKAEQMPNDACQYFYECENCHKILKPQSGDCCVFCSYGDIARTPVQEKGRGACG